MGTWGEGLYDNDSALDCLGDLLQIDDDVKDIGALTARIGLAAWLNPVAVCYTNEELNERFEALSKDFDRLPQETVNALEELLEDPDSATKQGSRKAEAAYVIGGYSDGPLIDALLRFPGAKPVIDAFGEQMAKELDETLKPNGRTGLYEVAGALATLGVLVELAGAGFYQPAAARVEQWREHFAIIDKATKSERGFWWKYVRRVQAAFDLLESKPIKIPGRNTDTKDSSGSGADVIHAQFGPVERYRHPKFGMGILVNRSGTGDEAKLEIRFEDGLTRKLLAKFVTKVDAGE
ncbi:MAG TPA: hypothetical protein PKA58_03145 [Polyangium sp.]|nr:hypothetical protein [Polyangium sp.]